MKDLRIPVALATVAAALVVVASGAAGSVIPHPISSDKYTDGGSGHQHKTQVEPDSFAHGNTIVAVSQSGRWFGGGGSSNLMFSTSHDAGRTWATGGLPGTTVNEGGTWPRISDPSVAYDPQDNVWLALGLGIDAGGSGHILLVNRSTDGVTWSNPVVAGESTGSFWDKTWISCDTWPQSPYYGNCYIEYDDNGAGNVIRMVTSTDGGVTWGPIQTPGGASGLGGQPVSLPDGTVVVPYTANYSAVYAVRSLDGGATWQPATLVAGQSSTGDHEMRDPPMPTAEVDSSGRVYVAWSDCAFESGCNANDIVMTSSTNGLNWTSLARIPTNPVGSGVDHLIPGLAVDPNTGGSTAHLALTYYYFPAGSSDLNVGFTSSVDSGATWTTGRPIAPAMQQEWVAYTNQGYMVGDYISTSFTGDGKAHPVFSLAKAPTTGSTCYPSNSLCNQRLTSATFDITVPWTRTPTRHERRYIPHRRPEDPVGLPTAN